jgi:hypothetical protein
MEFLILEEVEEEVRLVLIQEELVDLVLLLFVIGMTQFKG